MQSVPLVNVSPILQYLLTGQRSRSILFFENKLFIFLAVNHTSVTCVRYKSITLQKSNKAFFMSSFAYSQKRCDYFKSSPSEVFLVNGVLQICSKFTGEHPYRSPISMKLPSNFIEIALRNGCSPVNLLHIFRKAFPNDISGWLLLLNVIESSVNDRELLQVIRLWYP